MGKKRKSVANNLDEIDRTFNETFCSAANSLSQLYTQAMNYQKLSFHAGQRHGLEKLYQWILRQQEGGTRVATVDILTYLQNELDYCGEEGMSPRAPVQHHYPQAPARCTNSGFLVSGPSAQPRLEQENQAKNLVFSNALSSPVRRSLQHYHLAQEGYHPNGSTGTLTSNVVRSGENNFAAQSIRESNSNDSLMDVHQDSPRSESNF